MGGRLSFFLTMPLRTMHPSSDPLNSDATLT